jgi:hypothetical protein
MQRNTRRENAQDKPHDLLATIAVDPEMFAR